MKNLQLVVLALLIPALLLLALPGCKQKRLNTNVKRPDYRLPDPPPRVPLPPPRPVPRYPRLLAEESEVAFRGVMIVSNSARDPSYSKVLQALDHLESLGTLDTIVVTPFLRMENANAPTVALDDTDGPTFGDLRFLLKDAKRRGFRTAVQPLVQVNEGDWHGFVHPEDVQTWFESYTSCLLELASLASDLGASLIVIGTELRSLSGISYENRWSALITEIREVFDGDLSYASGWNERVSFWRDLDLIGVSGFPLSDAASPALEELISGWSDYRGAWGERDWVSELESLSLELEKPVLFTGIGYRSGRYSARDPGAELPGCSYDPELQARCYQAFLEVFSSKPWCAGALWWAWGPGAETAGEDDCGYSPQGKPAEDVLRGWKTPESDN